MALEKGQQIYGMKVSFLLKDSNGIATYRVRDNSGMLKVLKHGAGRSELQYGHLSFLYADQGEDYVLYHHINGETLEKRLTRMLGLEEEEATDLTKDILRQLVVFHKAGLAYGNFSADNILVEVHGERPKAYLCGMGKLTKVVELKEDQSTKDKETISVTESTSYSNSSSDSNQPSSSTTTTELISEEFKDDLEGVARMIQLMLEGYQRDERVKVRLGAPKKETLLQKVMNKAFAREFESAQGMIDALEGKLTITQSSTSKGQNKEGRGFSAVAGMSELKEQLRSEVIDILADREGAQKYGVDIPNGMLLYGPPGCGKTFIAEKLAQETDYNYKYVKASDLGSTYIHGSQEKIAQLFDQARREAPTILCFDEFDALVPSRDDVNHSSLRSEVNEFLTQLNNCGKDGVFVIATTNRPDKIDTAILRSGRIDYIIYVPVPDLESRKEIFKINISTRPHQDNIDFQALAELTQGYVASDIAAVVQQSARQAFKNKELITMELLKSVIRQRNPSLSKETIAQYDRLRSQFENRSNTSTRKPIGFS